MNRSDYTYSVVIPLYRSELTIRDVVAEVVAEFGRIGVEGYEIVLVNDGSPDNVLAVATDLVRENPRITVIDLAKNSGQACAVIAGLKQATGDYVITMDDDMQTPGDELGTLIDAILERDDDVVFASYDESENDRPLIRRMGTRVNWWFAEKFAGKPKGIQSNSFRIMKRFVRDAYIQYEGHQIYSYGIIYHCTSHISNVTVKHRPRAVGKSGFTFRRLLSGLITGALTFSPLPLRVAAIAGFLLFIASVIGMIVAVVIHRFYIGLFWGMALILAFQFLALGVLGEYVNRIFTVEMHYPRYTVRNVFVNEGGGVKAKPPATCDGGAGSGD